MPKIAYIDKNFRTDSLKTIDICNAIIAQYQAQGFILTLRQLYYQLVSRDLIENSQRSYKRLGSIVNDARMAGLIDWHAIEDRGRNLRANSHWQSPAEIIDSAHRSFRLDLWEGQPYRPEIWVEKEALVGVLVGVCGRLDVPYFACKGYNSQSEQWRAGRRLHTYIRAGQTPLIFHLGDHDPSGIDMTRDNRERLALFMGGVEVRRLALNMDQVEQFNPPPNPAKEVDSRFASYVDLYGYESWELDALEPQVITDLIERAILTVRDDAIFAEQEARQEEHRHQLRQLVERWDDVVELL